MIYVKTKAGLYGILPLFLQAFYETKIKIEPTEWN